MHPARQNQRSHSGALPAAAATPRSHQLRRSVRRLRGDNAQHGHGAHRSGHAAPQPERTVAGRLRVPVERSEFVALREPLLRAHRTESQCVRRAGLRGGPQRRQRRRWRRQCRHGNDQRRCRVAAPVTVRLRTGGIPGRNEHGGRSGQRTAGHLHVHGRHADANATAQWPLSQRFGGSVFGGCSCSHNP